MILVALMAVMMAVPVMAADGVNADEEGLYNYFTEQVKSQSWLGKKLTKQYLTESENALIKADLDAAACEDLKGGIDAVMKIIKDNNIKSLHAAKLHRDDFLKATNDVANKYELKVDLNAKTGVATVYYKGEPVTDTSSVVKQTGVNFSSTLIVLAVLAVAAAGAVVIRRRNVIA